MTSTALPRTSPLLIREIAEIVCSFVDQDDLLNVAFSCRAFFSAACGRIWKTLNPDTHMTLRRVRQALEGRYAGSSKREPFSDYRQLVTHFYWNPRDKGFMLFERQFFDVFQFPRLVQLDFSYAAAQDQAVQQIIQSAPLLRHVNLSLCYCLSTEAIRPLLTIPPRLETLILYGCGKIEHETLATAIVRHRDTLTCIRLTDINNRILQAIQQCPRLQDIGLEHCSESLSTEQLERFTAGLSSSTSVSKLRKIRMRDVATLTADHLSKLALATATTLVHLDMSECNLVSREGFLELATHCRSIESLSLVHQFSVTDQVIQLFISNCAHLKLLDVSGCRLLTERAFHPWIDGSVLLEQSPMEILNISGLQPDVSPAVVLHMLQNLPCINEVCLGVAYEHSDAVEVANTADGFHLNIGRCVTICRASSMLQSRSSASFTTPF